MGDYQGGWIKCHHTARPDDPEKEAPLDCPIKSGNDRCEGSFRGRTGVSGVSPIFSTIVNQNREVQRDHPLAGDLGVSPNPLSTSPMIGG